MGYRAGQGLGKSEQGMSIALQVEKTSKRGGKIIHERDIAKSTLINHSLFVIFRFSWRIFSLQLMLRFWLCMDERLHRFKCHADRDADYCVALKIMLFASTLTLLTLGRS